MSLKGKREECKGLISNNELKRDVVKKIAGSLVDIKSHGFSKPIVNRGDWTTTITCMLKNIALEVEIDWKESVVFMLIVRLENGNLSKGYYMSEGQPCRYHLQKVIRDRKWSVDQDALALISPGSKSKRQNTHRSGETILDTYFAYKRVLDSCLDKLVDERDTIFNVKFA